MSIKSNKAFNTKAFSGTSIKSNASVASSVIDKTSGIPHRKVRSFMKSIDENMAGGNSDNLRDAVMRSGGRKDTLSSIDPVPSVRNTSAKAFAENT